jgi:carbon-monoxide dehydrogenase iron sulfur subunit
MIFEMPTCGGCRTCEMACSFKHSGMFVPSMSSLKIVDKDDGSGYRLILLEDSGSQGYACDLCQERDVPLCVEYCHMADDLMKILSLFEHSRNGFLRDVKS